MKNNTTTSNSPRYNLVIKSSGKVIKTGTLGFLKSLVHMARIKLSMISFELVTPVGYSLTSFTDNDGNKTTGKLTSVYRDNT